MPWNGDGNDPKLSSGFQQALSDQRAIESQTLQEVSELCYKDVLEAAKVFNHLVATKSNQPNSTNFNNPVKRAPTAITAPKTTPEPTRRPGSETTDKGRLPLPITHL